MRRARRLAPAPSTFSAPGRPRGALQRGPRVAAIYCRRTAVCSGSHATFVPPNA
ncbi:hypothetical protein RRG08_050670, partial [Elysia crispata]